MLLTVVSTEAEAARRALGEHWDADLEESLKVHTSTVVDFDSDETTCPACLSVFSTENKRCPECGLNFGG